MEVGYLLTHPGRLPRKFKIYQSPLSESILSVKTSSFRAKIVLLKVIGASVKLSNEIFI